MAKPSVRPPVAGPPLIRALAPFGQHPYSTVPLDLPATLGGWVDWNRAVALARALDGPAAPAPEQITAAVTSAPSTPEGLEQEVSRARASHADAIAALLDRLEGPQPPDAAELQRLHATLQRGQLASTGRLRGQLRDLLALRDAQGARLAAIDGVMEQALAPREYRLLDALPTHLATHAAGALASPPAADAAPADLGEAVSIHWPAGLRDHVRDLLQAELDLRFLPLEGLLAALRQH